MASSKCIFAILNATARHKAGNPDITNVYEIFIHFKHIKLAVI